MELNAPASMMPAPPPLSRLRKLAASASPEERCELCAAMIASEHQHLLELKTHKLVCACDACAILFDSDQAGRYRRVPRTTRRLDQFVMDDQAWEALGIPINLAFFYRSSSAGRMMAMYPSPGGAMESLLPLDAWSDLVYANPAAARIAEDVEALLINRIAAGREAFIVPIDQCYRLVGVIRSSWQGISGGTKVWRAIAGFFEDLNKRSAPNRGSRP